MSVQSAGNPANPTLIIYLLLKSNEESNEANFQYYLREGISEDDGCSHVILIDSKKARDLYRQAQTTHISFAEHRNADCLTHAANRCSTISKLMMYVHIH